MRLKHVATLRAGGTPDTNREDFWADGDGIPWVSIGDMSSGQPVRETARQLSPLGLEDRALSPSPAGTVLFAMYASVGAVATLAVDAAWNQAILGIAPRPGLADSRFLSYWLRHYGSISIAEARTATQANLNADQVANFPFPDRSLHVQRRTADFLDDRVARIDQIITARRTQGSSLDDAARATLAGRMLADGGDMPLRHLVVHERLGLWGAEPGEDELDVRVARVADFERAEFRLGDVPTIRSATAAQIGARELRHGDVLLERSGGTNINPVGCPAFVEHPATNTVSSNFVSRLRPAPGADGRYLSLLLGALYATGQQRPHSNQTTGIQNLDTTSYLHVRIPERGHAVQIALAHEVDDALSRIRAQQRQLRESVALLEEYKQALITAAVTGELDVTTAGSGIPA